MRSLDDIPQEEWAFEWDEAKRISNRHKHGIDFDDVVLALAGPRLETQTMANGELRVLATCPESGRLITAVYTMRGNVCRIISARVREKMSEENITRTTIAEILEKRARGEKSQTDWARVDAITDEDIERAMRDDPDWKDFMDIDWSKARMVIPDKKKAISIRLDPDIIDFFQATGKGYQTRINAVLRHFVDEQKRSKP